MGANKLKDEIISIFGQVASSIGYSPLHGKIIAILMVKDKPVSLQELAKETGYSVSMISLSLDLLEVLGVVRKVKKTADRKLYVEMTGDLIETLKNAVVIKVEKNIKNSLDEFERVKKHLNTLPSDERQKTMIIFEKLESEIKRLGTYIKLLSRIRIP